MNALWDAALTVLIIAAVISLGEWMRRRTRRRMREEALAQLARRKEYADRLAESFRKSAGSNMIWAAMPAFGKNFGRLEVRVENFEEPEVRVQYRDHDADEWHEVVNCIVFTSEGLLRVRIITGENEEVRDATGSLIAQLSDRIRFLGLD